MGQGDTGTEAVSAADGVRVERSVERKESGLTAEYEIRSLAGSPLRFRVREPLDPETDVDEIGFHPEHEPEEWSIEERAVVFEGIASPEDAFRTVLGAVVDTGEFLVADPEVERIVRETGEEAESGPESRDRGVLAGVRTRLFGASGAAADEPEGDVEAVTVDRSAEADGGAGEGVLADVEAGLVSEDGPGSGDGSGGETDEAAGGRHAGEDPATEESREPVAREAEPATEAVGGDSGGEPAGGSGGDAAAGAETADGGQRVRSSRGAGEAEADPGAPDPAAVVAAVREDETLREELRDALGVEANGGGSNESTDVRLRHVQSRVDDLAAYTDVLEEAIDEHGRPAAVLSDLREEAAELRTEIAEVHEEVAETREEVATVRGQQETTRERVEDLADATADLRGELEDTRDRHGSRIDRLEGDVDGVAADVRAARDDLNAELADLQSEMADLREMRETLSTAFSAVGAPERPDGHERESGGEREAEPDEGAEWDGEGEEQERQREREQEQEQEQTSVADAEPVGDDGQ